jgi:hypothetical protein
MISFTGMIDWSFSLLNVILKIIKIGGTSRLIEGLVVQTKFDYCEKGSRPKLSKANFFARSSQIEQFFII